MLVEQAPRVRKEEGEATTWLKTRDTRQIRDSHRHRQSFVVLMQETWVLWPRRERPPGSSRDGTCHERPNAKQGKEARNRNKNRDRNRNRNHLVNNTRRRQGQDVERATPTLGR